MKTIQKGAAGAHRTDNRMDEERGRATKRAAFLMLLAAVALVAPLATPTEAFLRPLTTTRHHHFRHPAAGTTTTFHKHGDKIFLPWSPRDPVSTSVEFPITITTLFMSRMDDEDDDDEEDEEDSDINVADQDWRAFRAKLVMGEPSSASSSSSTKTTKTTTASTQKSESEKTISSSATDEILDDGDLDGIGALFSSENDVQKQLQQQQQQSQKMSGMTPLDPSQWAYDSGTVIEQGAVILGGVEQDYGFGLRQQYFHKAAILVLDHDEHTFTRGIILNRPSDLTLDDDINEGVQWRVYFGGDVQGLDAPNPDICCLHTLQIKKVMRASIPVMNDIQYTTFDVAKKLVQAGHAKPTDFWLFAGYAGWSAGQLMGELERRSWYMVATDSQTLLKELKATSAAVDPRDAGLDTWQLLMDMIGRSETAAEHTGGFDDLMLKEWARQHLLSVEAGGGASRSRRPPLGPSTQELSKQKKSDDPVEQLMQRVSAAARGEDVTEGTLVRAAPTDRSPFLLDNQALHKSLVLVISEDAALTVGVVLNRPGAQGLEVKVQQKDSGKSRLLHVPLRYGGPYSVKSSEPILWLHCNSILKAAKVGAPVGSSSSGKSGNDEGIWKCTSSDMISAVGQGLATPEDFLVVAGVSVWTKGENGLARGMSGEIRSGKFEIVPPSKTQAVWNELSRQEVLTEDNLAETLAVAEEAWRKGANDKEKAKNGKNGSFLKNLPIVGGLGEGFDEEDDSLVFKSDVKVSKLSDDALRSWVATFLLNKPSLGRS